MTPDTYLDPKLQVFMKANLEEGRKEPVSEKKPSGFKHGPVSYEMDFCEACVRKVKTAAHDIHYSGMWSNTDM